MLKTKGESFKGKTVAISGSGNVAQYATEKVIDLGGSVVTMSDSSGSIYDPNGIDKDKLYLLEIGLNNYGKLLYSTNRSLVFNIGKKKFSET